MTTQNTTSRRMYIPPQWQSPTVDAAANVLELMVENLDANDLAGPQKLGALVKLVLREVETHKGPLSDGERRQWHSAVTGAAHALKSGNGCLEYHPPSRRGGHGVYMFKGVRGDADTAAPQVQSANAGGSDAPAWVYGWCLPHYQRDEMFPVKVGRTERSPAERAHDNLTDLPEDPKVLMEIPCQTPSDAEKTEMIFHHVLRMRGRSIRGRGDVGREWFTTNSLELREIAAFILGERAEADFTD